MEITPHDSFENIPTVSAVAPFDKTKLILPGAILIAAILISGTVLYSNGTLGGGNNGVAKIPDPNQKVNVSAGDDLVLGKADAKVTIIEFSDFQCPFCRTFWTDTLPLIKKTYIDTGKVKLVYRDYPLTSLHPMSEPSAEAFECAQDQNKGWEMHDKMFGEQAKKGTGTIAYTVADLKTWAKQIGLEAATFNQCLDSGKYKDEVAKDIADGTAAGVSGTPSFFVNGRLLVGAQPFAQFQALIEKEL